MRLLRCTAALVGAAALAACGGTTPGTAESTPVGTDDATEAAGPTRPGRPVPEGSSDPTAPGSDASETPPAGDPATSGTDDHVLFAINVQDFAHPDLSAQVVSDVLGLHESLDVPVDLYLTDTIVLAWEQADLDVIDRIRASSVADVSYHYRAPRPYDASYDWLGLRDLDDDALYDTILAYETFALDPATGELTDQPGGFAHVTSVFGTPPLAAGAKSDDDRIASTTLRVFDDLGATLTVTRGGGSALNLGDDREGIPVRPEHHDLKLFEVDGEADEVLPAALDAAHRVRGGEPPWFVGVKMHDNDFFAEQSAWVTVYVDGGKRPPWDTSLRADLLDDATRAQRWQRYEDAVRWVADHPDLVTAVGLHDVIEMLDVAG